MTPPTYDEKRLHATPCEGGCGRLVTVPGRCRDCRRARVEQIQRTVTRRLRQQPLHAQPDAHPGGCE